ERIKRNRDFFTAHINVDRLLDLIPESHGLHGFRGFNPCNPRLTVALARDAAFSFYYRANRDALERAGAKIVEFSPIHDKTLPEVDSLYIGGGYPELYRKELAANVKMRRAIRNHIESGKRFYAECGGMMYL